MAPHESNSSRLFICSKQAELLQSKWRNIVDSVASLHQSTQHSGGIFQIFQIVLLLKQLVRDRLEFFLSILTLLSRFWIETLGIYFQILWKSKCNIFVSFPSHLKKLRSILRKNTTKQLFQSKFQCRNSYFCM